MSRLLPGWRGRTQVERVDLYTRGSLYLLFWFLVPLAALGAASAAKTVSAIVVIVAMAAALGVAGTVVLRESIRLYPAYAPVPWRSLTVLGALVVVTEVLVFSLPEDARFAATLVVVPALAWGAGGLRDRRIQWGLAATCALLPFLATGSLGLAAYGLGVSVFLIFTVQSTLWILDVVTELERSRQTQAALAVAEERLRFSHDVHDVLGRRLSTIAVQAELAATLAARGDDRAPQHILEVRETAHDALREARQLAHGYRPLDLSSEIDGAISLLRSAGITCTADLGDLPTPWHEPVARVIREAVTNVLRHSNATRVEMTYADSVVVIRNDGAQPAGANADVSRPAGGGPTGGTTGGTGLLGLAEHLAPSGASITTERDGEHFVVRVDLTGSPARVRAGTGHQPAHHHPADHQPAGHQPGEEP